MCLYLIVFIQIFFLCTSSAPNQVAFHMDGNSGVKHCHDNSHAQEDREREKKFARKRLYVVSVICLIFMIGEILGKSLCFSHFLSSVIPEFSFKLLFSFSYSHSRRIFHYPITAPT